MDATPKHLRAIYGPDEEGFWDEDPALLLTYKDWGVIFTCLAAFIAVLMVSAMLITNTVPRSPWVDIPVILFIVTACGALCMLSIHALTADDS